jgi:hypothetical protein
MDEKNKKRFPPPPPRHLVQPSLVVDNAGHIITFYLPGILPRSYVVRILIYDLVLN